MRSARKLSMSEFDSNMADVFNRVLYRGESFVIQRKGRDIAILAPLKPDLSVTVKDVVDAIGDLSVPKGLADGLEAVLKEIPPLEDPQWLK